MARYKVEDLTQQIPSSDLIAVVHYEKIDGYIEIRKDGSVRLVSPDGVVSARFRELEKQEWARNSYINTLLASGVRGQELEKALQAIARVDKKLAEAEDPDEIWAELEQKTNERFRQWCAERGIDHDSLTEDEFMALVDEAVRTVREKRQ